MPLHVDETYKLEDIYTINRTSLNKMCWLFDVSGWVGNVPNLLREAIFHIPRFAGVYQALSEEQQRVLSFLCESIGRPVRITHVYEYFSHTMAVKKLDEAIADLLQQGWLLEGEKPHSLLAVPEFSYILDKMSAFYYFLETELAAEYQATVGGGQYLADLIEMAAFLYVEKPKLTIKGFMSKTILRRLVSRLSLVATEQWEEAAEANTYTNTMRMLLGGLQEIEALQLVADKGDHRSYQLSAEKWDDFIFSPASHRLLATLSWQITRINSRKGGSLSFVTSLLIHAAHMEGRWQTGARLMMESTVAESTIIFSERDPFGSEEWLETFLLEPMMYLGLFEKTTAELPTPWLKEAQMPRNFWRLTAIGLGLVAWLLEQKDPVKALNQMVKMDLSAKDVEVEFYQLFEKWQEVLPQELDQQLIIQPDLTFFVPKTAPPYLLWILSIFGNSELQDYVYQGSFSRESVLRALKGGVSISELFAVIKDHSKVLPAENVMTVLQQWAAAYDRTLLSRATLLACDSSEMMTEILAQSKLSQWIIGPLGSQTLVIKPEGEAVIRKWLEKKNWVPRPGVVNGEGLYTWLRAVKK